MFVYRVFVLCFFFGRVFMDIKVPFFSSCFFFAKGFHGLCVFWVLFSALKAF